MSSREPRVVQIGNVHIDLEKVAVVVNRVSYLDVHLVSDRHFTIAEREAQTFMQAWLSYTGCLPDPLRRPE